MFKELTKICIQQTSTIAEAISVIDAADPHIALVVNDQQRLLGTITDGDIRRMLLRGGSLKDSVTTIMNNHPITVGMDAEPQAVLKRMRETRLLHIPVVDPNGTVIGVETLRNLITLKQHNNPVVIMAGGLGSRLSPLTLETPKPMLKVGEKPLLETILERFIEQGFNNFFFSVNYKAEIIKEYFGNGDAWNVDIKYLHEHQPLGTAGCLTLVEEPINAPFFLMNGDILTSVDFESMLNFHIEHNSKVTMAVRQQEVVVPYGVVEIDGHSATSITEKPKSTFFINAGIYVADPTVLDIIPKGLRFDMTELLENIMAQGDLVNTFPIREYWIDIGHFDDLERAERDYSIITTTEDK